MLNYFRQFRKYSMLVFLFVFTIPLFLSGARVETVSASSVQQEPYVHPFLYPPYPGTVEEISIFDHQTPVNARELSDGVIIAFTGNEASGDPITDEGVYWNNDLGFALSYDQHEGIDYDVNYAPVFAAADSDQVIAAGWSNPLNHNSGLGLNVGLLHANGYRTYYGHLSAIAVTTCPIFQCATIIHGDVIGISGDTGNSGGPHLHFEIRNPIPDPVNGEYRTRIDPYGWTGAGADPWEDAWRANPNQSLWVDHPEISGSDSLLYATNEGDPLTFPLFPGSSNSVLVDDYGRLLAENGQVPLGSSPNFTAGNCWTVPNEDPLITNIDPLYIAEDQYKLLALTTATECIAEWSLPADRQTGNYAIYVHIPGSYNSLVNSVVYRVYAGGEEVAKVLVNQKEIESYLESAASSEDLTVNSAWIYVGKYYFIQGEDNSIHVSNVPEEPIQPGTVVLADAVKFVPTTTGNTPTPTPTPTTPPNTQTIRVSINKGSDDAGTNPTPCVSNATDNEIYLGACFNGNDITSGFRFENVQIPQAQILKARMFTLLLMEHILSLSRLGYMRKLVVTH
ncbi:MAG: peptidoglycan DD-metalloendopeptidase family protein [Anaerolineae bacterium]|nr:peptidoglycan DD-metalloendopeptidase family protein [Anaerolineae bacterium]